MNGNAKIKKSKKNFCEKSFILGQKYNIPLHDKFDPDLDFPKKAVGI